MQLVPHGKHMVQPNWALREVRTCLHLLAPPCSPRLSTCGGCEELAQASGSPFYTQDLWPAQMEADGGKAKPQMDRSLDGPILYSRFRLSIANVVFLGLLGAWPQVGTCLTQGLGSPSCMRSVLARCNGDTGASGSSLGGEVRSKVSDGIS